MADELVSVDRADDDDALDVASRQEIDGESYMIEHIEKLGELLREAGILVGTLGPLEAYIERVVRGGGVPGWVFGQFLIFGLAAYYVGTYLHIEVKRLQAGLNRRIRKLKALHSMDKERVGEK